jgi:hypothetical protein
LITPVVSVRRVWRYQRGNQNPYIEEEQTTQWPKEKVQKDKQRSTKHTYKTRDRVTRTPLKTGVFYLVFCVVFYRSLFVVLHLFLFGHCVVCPSLIYGFWLPLWYLKLYLVFCVVFCRSLLAILFFFFWPLSILLQFKASDCMDFIGS